MRGLPGGAGNGDNGPLKPSLDSHPSFTGAESAFIRLIDRIAPLNPPNSAVLYVVATPIGNLGDITLRALEILRTVDVIAAEDTRVTLGLLRHFNIGTSVVALHKHNERAAADKILGYLSQGKCVALVSDAGTPAISDPGALTVAGVRDQGFRVEPIPGPSALTTVMSVAGLHDGRFLFYGFAPPKTAERKKALTSLARLPFPMVFYEAPHRIKRFVEDAVAVFGADRPIILAREVTKLYEEFHRCTLSDAGNWIDAHPHREKGEYVVVIQGVSAEPDARRQDVLPMLLEELPLSQAVKIAVRLTGEKRDEVYRRALSLKADG